MKIKVGINGMGRIGRMIIRSIVENKYKKIAFPPILPKAATLPKFATPHTIEKKTTGTISIFKDEMKIFPSTETISIK